MIESSERATALIMRPMQGRRIATSERKRTNAIDSINGAWYQHASARAARASVAPFELILARILRRYHDDVARQPVLDIGFVAGHRERVLGVRFERCDLGALGAFASYSFHCVLDSSGVLGTIGHAPRLRALHEIARLMPPHGVFVFAAHNRRCVRAVRRPRLEWSRNPVKLLANAVCWMRRYRNRVRLRALQYDGPDYALINDPTHEYALLHYHISTEAQRSQLESAGFRVIEMYDSKGRPLVESADDRSSPWIWYVARRVDIRLVR